MRTVSLMDMESRMDSSSRRASRSSSRWNRIEVWRMRSTRSKTSAPSWSRTVSPRMRPSRRMSLRSRASSSTAWASSGRLVRASVSVGMIWEDIFRYSRMPGSYPVCNFFDAAQDEEDDGISNFPPGLFPIGVAQAPLENLAGIFPRQLGSDVDVLGNLVVGKYGFQMAADVNRIQCHAWLQLDHRHQGLAVLGVRNAE